MDVLLWTAVMATDRVMCLVRDGADPIALLAALDQARAALEQLPATRAAAALTALVLAVDVWRRTGTGAAELAELCRSAAVAVHFDHRVAWAGIERGVVERVDRLDPPTVL